MKYVLFIAFSLCFSVLALFFYCQTRYPATPPLTAMAYFFEHLIKPHAKLKQEVIGFLPYWRLDDIQAIKLTDLSEINYFSFSVDDDGHILQATNNETDPGWNGWNKQTTKNFITKAQIMGTKVSITIAVLNNNQIESLLQDKAKQQVLITDILKEVKERHLSDVNIDFEYTGDADKAYQEYFTNFSNDLVTALKKQDPHATVSLSLMPLTMRQDGIYDFSKLATLYDRFIGMSYDFYGQNADIAGPVAPMRGFKEKKYFFDITTMYEDFLAKLPKDKIVMGVPYYGWEWGVVDGKTINSKTLPAYDPNNYAAVISYARARESGLNKKQCRWDIYAEETWCWFTDTQTGTDRQTWIVDNAFIQTRFDYAKKQQFTGVAIWTLGLDKNYPDLWKALTTTFSH